METNFLDCFLQLPRFIGWSFLLTVTTYLICHCLMLFRTLRLLGLQVVCPFIFIFTLQTGVSIVYLWLAWNSVGRSGWPWTCACQPDLPASASKCCDQRCASLHPAPFSRLVNELYFLRAGGISSWECILVFQRTRVWFLAPTVACIYLFIYPPIYPSGGATIYHFLVPTGISCMCKNTQAYKLNLKKKI
jgi:hypothetical protein